MRRVPPLSASDEASTVLTDRQKLSLLHDSGMRPTAILSLEDSEFNFEGLLRRGCTAANVVCSGLMASQLQARGVKSANMLRRLGFDSLHLVDAGICSDFSNVYGADAIRRTFLTTPSDAVVVSGSEAPQILGLTPDFLLSLCAGAPVEASNVISQHDAQGAELLKQVSVGTLLDTGLRAAQLKALGIGLLQLSALDGFGNADATKFGFQL